MKTPNAPPVVRNDHVQEYKDLLICLFEHPQWSSMGEGSRNRALDVLKVAADTALEATELAHVEVLTRNTLATSQLKEETIPSAEDESDSVAAEILKIKAETEKVKAGTALAVAQEERWRAEERMLQAENSHRHYVRTYGPEK
ncbi:hypothetical protein P167DRAFT_138267 [Morchella conica CCBAS932]|uniref:Uncharacterized protein n=1 Tax=Morchella conica CCBAS932 TaxID=1392247 RepID=A0A3N4K7I0_9PEZI|nr:hypothetical protein P167DRAFT_138267 [Morchella conica CCBAS932]